jgi:hypothetical protein
MCFHTIRAQKFKMSKLEEKRHAIVAVDHMCMEEKRKLSLLPHISLIRN